MSIQYQSHPAMFKAAPFKFIFLWTVILASLVGAIYFGKAEQAYAILCLFLFLAGLLYQLVWFVKVRCERLTIDEKEILYESGILSKRRTEIGLEGVRTVDVYQTFLNRIFGVGRVSLFTAGDQAEIVINNFPQPHRIREIVKMGTGQ